jgi:hypothetical protein
MANPATLRPFPPGVSGNPNGRPKGSSITARIRARCAQDTDDGRTIAERIADRFVAEALKGKFPFAREVLDRVDGKVTEKVEINGADGGPIIVDATVRDRADTRLDSWRKEQAEKLAALSSSVPSSMPPP